MPLAKVLDWFGFGGARVMSRDLVVKSFEERPAGAAIVMLVIVGDLSL